MAEPFRANLFQPIASRVSSDSQPASNSSFKKSHLHSLHHPHRHHHQHRSSRHHAKEVVQSAIQLHPPTSFGDLLRPSRSSRDTTPADSRRESVQADGRVDVDGQAESGGPMDGREREVRRPVRPEDVAREQRRVKTREEELRSSLQSLSDQSLKTSRRLDDTYYFLLEKASVLRQTIGSLQELYGLTKELHENFQADTYELVEDVQDQFEGFHNFERQAEQVKVLQGRIEAGKEKADVLNARLAEAKKHVEARAQSEAELESRNTRRVRIIWSIIGTVVGLITMAILFQRLRPIHVESEPRTALDFASRAKILDAPIPDIAKEAIMSSRTTPGARVETPVVQSIRELEEDHRLRIFDEL